MHIHSRNLLPVVSKMRQLFMNTLVNVQNKDENPSATLQPWCTIRDVSLLNLGESSVADTVCLLEFTVIR